MPTIRQCRDDERPEILRIVNDGAEAYRGVIPVDCWHEPYMPADELAHEIAAGGPSGVMNETAHCLG